MEDLSQINEQTRLVQSYKDHSKKFKLSKRARDYIFVILMLLYPVLQFALIWSFVNIQSVLNAFRQTDVVTGNVNYGLQNFIDYFTNLFNNPSHANGTTWINDTAIVLLNSLAIGIITVFISLPLSLLSAYFLHKKMPFANVFRAIFFLPNIIPVVALTFAFKTAIDGNFGYLYDFFIWLGMPDAFIVKTPYGIIVLIIYLIWAGLGYNIIFISGAIGRIPKELFESAQLDHAGYFKEFVHVVIPCIWPTVVTLIIVGMTNVLTLYLQPMLLVGTDFPAVYTISLEIFLSAKSGATSKYESAAAFGLLMSAIWAPVIIISRKLLSKKYQGVDY